MAGTGGNKGAIDPGSDLGTSPVTDDIGTSEVNFGGKSPLTYVQFLIGADIFTLFGDKMLNEAFEQSFKEVVDIILDTNVLRNLGNSERFLVSDNTTYDDTGFTYEKRILKVLRQSTTDEDSDGSVQHYYECRETNKDLTDATNQHSIYYENDPYNPVWYININGGINVLPKNSSDEPTGKVYYMSYPKFGIGVEIDPVQTHNLGELSGLQNFSLISAEKEEEIFYGVPWQARNAIYLSMAVNLCNGYLSDHVQDEEDVELVQLLQAQLQVLTAKRAEEFQMVGVKFGVGGMVAKNE